MNALAHLTDSTASLSIQDERVGTSSLWRNAILAALIFASLLLVIYKAISVGMDRELSARYWNYAIPSYFSEVIYGAPRYTYFMEVATHLSRGSPFTKPATIHPLFAEASAGKVNVSTAPHFFPADEKGTVDFVKVAFAVFGIRVQSLFYLYCALLGFSVITFVVGFRDDTDALLVLLIGLVALYVSVCTLQITRELYSVTNPRAIGTLSFVGLLHLSLWVVRPRRLSVFAVIALTCQALLLVLVISMRTAEAWQAVAVFGLSTVAAGNVATRSRPISAMWPAATMLVIVGGYMCYQNFAYPDEYFSQNLRTKIFWHNVLIGFSLHPAIAQQYQIDLDDSSVLAYVKKRAGASGVSEAIFWGSHETPDGISKNYRAYDALCRNAVWEIVATHPVETLQLFVWYKPRLFFRSFQYAVGNPSHDLHYYAVHDQAVSLPTPAERRVTGAYFNPLSPVALLLLCAACLTAGVGRLKRTFDAATLTAVTAIFIASLLPGLSTYPVIHVITGTYWATALLLYVVSIQSAGRAAHQFGTFVAER
jgi:hypothetical protein